MLFFNAKAGDAWRCFVIFLNISKIISKRDELFATADEGWRCFNNVLAMYGDTLVMYPKSLVVSTSQDIIYIYIYIYTSGGVKHAGNGHM